MSIDACCYVDNAGRVYQYGKSKENAKVVHHIIGEYDKSQSLNCLNEVCYSYSQ